MMQTNNSSGNLRNIARKMKLGVALYKLSHPTRVIEPHYRSLTSLIRLLPNFIIVGASKSGTTTLYDYITAHPDVASASFKEVHFFDRNHNFKRGISHYRAQFPTIAQAHYHKLLHQKSLVTGEASPLYLFHPLAPKRIAEAVPNVKLIALLRNPVERAYSQYQMNLRRGVESLSFKEAIEKEKDRLLGEREKIENDENYTSINYIRYSYLSREIYINQLKEWYNLFDIQQFLILKSEDFFNNPFSIINQVFYFLGLSSW